MEFHAWEKLKLTIKEIMKSSIKLKGLLFFFYTIPLISLGIEAYAQEKFDNTVPKLNGHYFTPFDGVPGPFINSNFGSSIGVAFSNKFENVIIEIDGEPLLGLEGSLLFADLNFEYQQKIKDWIAIFIKVGVTARIGTELQSMLTQGVSSVTSVRLGWLFELAKGKKYMLSGTAQVNNHNGIFINVGDFISDIISDSVVTSISKNVPSLNGTIGLRYAYGFNDMFGFQLDFETGFGESFERGSTTSLTKIGGMVDMNLASRTKVPIGIVLAYNISTLPDFVYVKDRAATIAGLKIAYTGAPNFNLGLEISSMKVPIPNVSEKVRSTGVIITTRYYFN